MVFNQLSDWEDGHDLVVCIGPHGESYWLNYNFGSPLSTAAEPTQQQRLPLVRACYQGNLELYHIYSACLSGYIMELLVEDPDNLNWILQEILFNLPALNELTILLPFQQQEGAHHAENLINILIANFQKVFNPCFVTVRHDEIQLHAYNGNGAHSLIPSLEVKILDLRAYSSSSSAVTAAANTAAIAPPRGPLLDLLIQGILREMPTIKILICYCRDINTHIHEDTFHTIVSTSNLQQLQIRHTSLGPFEVSTLLSSLQQRKQQQLTTTTNSTTSTAAAAEEEEEEEALFPSTEEIHLSTKRRRLCNRQQHSRGGGLCQLNDLILDGIRIQQDQFSNLMEGLETIDSNRFNTITNLYLQQVNIYPSYNGGKKEFWNVIFSFLRHNKTLQTLTLESIADSSGLVMTALTMGNGEDAEDNEEEGSTIGGEYNFPQVSKGIESVLKNYNHNLGTLNIIPPQQACPFVLPKTVRELLHLNHYKVRSLIEDGTTTITKQEFCDTLIQVLEIKGRGATHELDEDYGLEFRKQQNGHGDEDESTNDDDDSDSSSSSSSENNDHEEESESNNDDDDDDNRSTRGSQEDDSYKYVFGFAIGYGTDLALLHCLFLVFRANPTLVNLLDGMPLVATRARMAKINKYIAMVSSYKAGRLLKLFLSNVVDNPNEPKFKSINAKGKAYNAIVKPILGAEALLMAVGFSPNEAGDALVLKENADLDVLKKTKERLESALAAYSII